jgi:hypothetical protein
VRISKTRASKLETCFRQLEANRRNTLRSKGPRIENGKQQSRRNALKHGLTAETVIEPLENPEEYRLRRNGRVGVPAANARRAGVRASPRIPVLATSPATSIETGLLRMQSEILHAFRSCRQKKVQEGKGRTVAKLEICALRQLPSGD